MGYDNLYLLCNDGRGWTVSPNFAGTAFKSDLDYWKDALEKEHPDWRIIIVKEVFDEE